MTAQPQITKQVILEEILSGIIVEGDYEAALLSAPDGLPVAVVATDETTTMMAAMTALLRAVTQRVRHELDMAYVNELSLVCDDRFRLVCRFFETDAGQPLILTLVVPPDQAYRRITNRAITAIKKNWSLIAQA